MFENAVQSQTKRVLEEIAQSKIKDDFYLAGGTALAIHLGHRESVDLDWFSPESFSNAKIKKELQEIGKLEISGEDAGTINASLDGVKISFFEYPYSLLYPYKTFKGVNLADERDIAAMKIDTVSSRGSKKDFFDLYFLLKKYSLEDLLVQFYEKYRNIKYNKLHILKSLSFFEDAESDPDPIILKHADWEEVKKEIEDKVNEISI